MPAGAHVFVLDRGRVAQHIGKLLDELMTCRGCGQTIHLGDTVLSRTGRKGRAHYRHAVCPSPTGEIRGGIYRASELAKDLDRVLRRRGELAA